MGKHKPGYAPTTVRARRNRKYVQDKKSERGCRRCGCKDHRVLHWHHLPQFIKRETLAVLCTGGYALKVLDEEMSKCEVLCANCHQIEHWEARNRKKIAEGIAEGIALIKAQEAQPLTAFMVS